MEGEEKMKRKNGGFSLIEVLVVLGIIGILSSFVTPKVMNYTAKAKDVKAVSMLESIRTAAEMRYLEEGKTFEKDGELTKDDMEDLKNYLSDNFDSMLSGLTQAEDVFEMEIGGSRESETGNIVYGGTIAFTTTAPPNKKADKINVWIKPQGMTKEYNISGEKWEEL